jgi:hypothetical protein
VSSGNELRLPGEMSQFRVGVQGSAFIVRSVASTGA